MSNADLYSHFVQERHRIYEARQAGLPQPWTDDPILASQKFTNVFRVLDPGSQFVLTDLATDNQEDLITRCVLYRMTNLPSTWRFIREVFERYPVVEDILETHSLTGILKEYRAAGNKVFSGAYIIMPEPGTANDKVEGAVRTTRHFVDNAMYTFLESETQEERFNALCSTPGIGKFLAMQILTDWGYVQGENRENEFIVAGPGARRGALHLSTAPSQYVIAHLTRKWQDSGEVRLGDYTPSLMDVQNTLCEFSKYYRFAVGGKAYRNRPYRPAHPGEQPAPVLPTWTV